MAKLWLDLGNTRLKYWLMSHDGQVIATDAHLHLKAPSELLLGLSDTFARFGAEFIGISSVLGDKINSNIAQSLKLLETPFEFARVHAQHTHLRSCYDASQLGVDRWLQMLGAVNPDHRQCIVGCGTALTLDLIDQGLHLGGYIFPNSHLQRKALHLGTQQIDVAVGAFDSLAVATNTHDAVNHGILLSVVGAISTLAHSHPDYLVTLTGGDAKELAPHLQCLPQPITLDEKLLLKGLMRYFD